MKINKENKKIIVWGLILFAIVFIVMYGQQFKLKQETGMFYINLLSGTHRQIEWVVETLENQTITETEFSALLGQIDALTSMTISSSNLYISTPEIIKNFRRTDSLVNNEEHRNEFIFY